LSAAHNKGRPQLGGARPLGHNLAALPVLLPAVIAIFGVIATSFVIRTRYRVKQSLYKSLREQRARKIETARHRALAETTAEEARRAGGESPLELTFGLISLAAALGLVLTGVVMAIGARG
jgi:hypothetical protein